MEHLHPIKAKLYELLELLLDDSHLVLLSVGATAHQLSRFFGLPPVNAGNNVAAGFLM